MCERAIRVSVLLVLGVSAPVFSEHFTLHFSAQIQTEGTNVFPDSFRALARTPLESNSLGVSSLLPPPPPPARGYVLLAKKEPSEIWLRFSEIYDPNAVNLLYPMTLSAYDPNHAGVSGISRITLENPEILEQISQDNLVYLRRFTAAGAFVESYDLLDPGARIIEWEVAAAQNDYARLDLLIMDRCLAADLAVNHAINLEDFILLAAGWNQAGPLPVDIFRDEKVDLKDLTILVEQWLCSCMP